MCIRDRNEIEAAAATDHNPRASPRCCGGNSRVTIARPSDWMMPLPKPCIVVSAGIVLILLKQRKGLHSKKVVPGVYVYAHSRKI